MKNLVMEPTEENLIQTIKENMLGRNKDIAYFYNLLLAQENACTIAIDGKWGSGKTFFVRQSILFINAKNPRSVMQDDKRNCIINSILPKRDDNNCALALYYDAWKNDNDTDPMLSLIYEIAKQLNYEYDFKDASFFKKAAFIAETISGRNISGLIESLKGDNPIEKFEEQRSLSEKIKQFFEDILTERGNHLILFIDELDRCKPSYAVRLLEQIKHYLYDDRLVFVFSVNAVELQHTIKQYYGNDFDACCYLDRFFDLKITLPPADRTKFYEKLELNTGYSVETVVRRIAETYSFELRGLSKFYRQVKTAIYNPTHSDGKYDFLFPEGKAKHFMLIYIVPLVIGLKIVNISLLDQFIDGKNDKPLLDLFASEDLRFSCLFGFLKNDESFDEEQGKTKVSKNEILKRVYTAIFINKYDGRKYCEEIGEYEFDANSKKFILIASSMLSNYADYEI